MKKLTKFLGISTMALLTLASCKKNDALVTVNTDKAGQLTASTTSPVIELSKLKDTTVIVNFSFTASDYGAKVVESNILQIDSVGDNWKKAASLALDKNATSLGLSTAAFDQLLLKAVAPGGTKQIAVRVEHVLSGATSVYSNVITMTVTPINLTAWVYAVGSFDGWPGLPNSNPGATDSLVSITGNGIYTGIINFPNGERDFLLLPAKTSYDNKYATNDPTGTTSSTVAVGAPNNFYAPAGAGAYLVTLNVNTKAIAFTPQWSVIGDATPGLWDTDTNMLLDKAKNTWYVTVNLISDGTKAIKFRFNNAWDVNLGGGNGTLTAGGGNIIIPATAPAGNIYKITLDPVGDTYTLVKQ